MEMDPYATLAAEAIEKGFIMAEWDLIEDVELRQKLQDQVKAESKANTQKAIEKRLKANSKNEELEKDLADLKVFRAAEAKSKLLTSFKEAGGKADVDLDDYKFDKYTNEEGAIDFKGFLEANKHLAAKTQTENDYEYKGNFNSGGDSEDEGSLIA